MLAYEVFRIDRSSIRIVIQIFKRSEAEYENKSENMHAISIVIHTILIHLLYVINCVFLTFLCISILYKQCYIIVLIILLVMAEGTYFCREL